MDQNLALMAGIIFFAGVVQGLTSFGFALVSVPVLSLLLPVKDVVPLVVLLSLGTNLIVLAETFRRIDLSKIWILVAASVLAAPVGVLFLSLVPANAIKTMAGVLIVLVSLAMLSGRSFRVRSERLAYLPIGFLSGFLNGSISMSGPPVALFMSNQNIEKDRFRANITAYAVILNVFTLATFLVSGMLKVGLTARLGCSALAMVAGVALGIAFAARIDQALFKRLTLILILSAGIWTLVTALK